MVRDLSRRAATMPVLLVAFSLAFVSALAVATRAAGVPICDAGGPYHGWCACPIDFDATGSTSPGGAIVSYAWSFGDGITGEGPTPTHTYYFGWDWSWQVVLTVTDDRSVASACTTSVHTACDMLIPPLECDAGGPYSAAVNEEIRFAGTAYVMESPSYTWDFGDGASAGGLAAHHAFQAAGEYTVTFEVRDLFLYACHGIPRDATSAATARVGLNPAGRTTWGAIKATFR